MGRSRVIIRRASYDYSALKSLIFGMADSLCGECENYCPAKAISCNEKRIYFDYDKCIQCYCCIEVCPHGELQAEEPFMGKAIRKLRKS